MKSVIIAAAQGIEQSKAYKVGYEIGYFVGSNFWEVVITAIVILAVILYLTFFRKRKKSTKTSF